MSSHSVQAAGLNLRPWVMRALGPRQLPLSSKDSLLSEKTLMPSPDFSLFEPSVVPVQGGNIHCSSDSWAWLGRVVLRCSSVRSGQCWALEHEVTESQGHPSWAMSVIHRCFSWLPIGQYVRFQNGSTSHWEAADGWFFLKKKGSKGTQTLTTSTVCSRNWEELQLSLSSRGTPV